MIDPYILPVGASLATPSLYYCFYKQDGNLHCSTSPDLKTWTPAAINLAHGENPCVIAKDNEYILYYAPYNGIGVKRSRDLINWRDDPDTPLLTLGQTTWPWAEARLTAGYVEDMRAVPGVGKYVMVFHGSGPGADRKNESLENANSHIGIAWSDDLKTWRWPK